MTDDTFPCGSPKYPASDAKPADQLSEPCGLYHVLQQLYGVSPEAPDAQDALMSTLWASAARFSEGKS